MLYETNNTLLLVLLLVLPLAACQSGKAPGSDAAEPTETATDAPAADEPVNETEANAVTDEPADPMVEAAWPVAEKICELYGLDIKKEDNSVSSTPPSSCTVLFFVPDPSASTRQVSICLEKDENGEWAVTGSRLNLSLSENDGIDAAKFESDCAELAWPELTVTAAELTEAGYGTEQADAAAYAAELMAKRFTECADGNYFKCKKARVVRQRQKGETNAYDTRLAMLPENAACFCAAYGDILGSLYLPAEGEEEFADLSRFITVYFNVNVDKTEEGSYNIYVDFLE